MYNRIAVIGDEDMIFPLRAMGFRVYVPEDLEDARRIFKSLDKENIALCFLHQQYFEPLRAEREALRDKFFPVVAGFSDFRDISGYLADTLKEMAVKATGSDALVKGKGKP
ncbi:MAG: V-type ATP synthase subunit F [Candidatus Aminicenantaceae bacterium]